MDPRLKHPFTCIISGPTGCGKTVFVKSLLSKCQDAIYPPPEQIVWCYGEWQHGYEALKGVEFVEGLPQMERFDGQKRTLLIIDDLMSEADDRVSNLFTKKSHHCNISVIYIVQNIFDKNKQHRTVSLNAHYMVVFKNPRDASQITHLAKQMYPGNVKFLQEAFRDATKEPHGYLVLDLKQSTEENMRVRSKVLDDVQVVYLPK